MVRHRHPEGGHRRQLRVVRVGARHRQDQRGHRRLRGRLTGNTPNMYTVRQNYRFLLLPA